MDTDHDPRAAGRRGAGGTPGGIGEFLLGAALAVAGALLARAR